MSAAPGPPKLESIGLVLHHDASWSHEGLPIRHARLREKFDRSVAYLPEEGKYVVAVGRFRAQVDVEEAGFFVRGVDLEHGRVHLSDGSDDVLALETLCGSSIDGAWICRVKAGLVEGGLPARFSHAAQAELQNGVEETDAGPAVRVAGRLVPLPDLD